MYASAEPVLSPPKDRFFARLAAEIFLSSLKSRSFSNLLVLLLSLLILPAATAARAAQVREIKEVKVAYPPSMASVTLMTGIKQKFFDDEGLRPTLLIISSDLALKSQVVGEIDYTLFGGGAGFADQERSPGA